MMSATLANRVINGVNAANAIEFLPGGVARVDVSNEKITVTFKTFDLIACDADGNQQTYRLVGIQIPNAEE